MNRYRPSHVISCNGSPQGRDLEIHEELRTHSIDNGGLALSASVFAQDERGIIRRLRTHQGGGFGHNDVRVNVDGFHAAAAQRHLSAFRRGGLRAQSRGATRYCSGTSSRVSLICWFWLAVTVTAVPPAPLRRIHSKSAYATSFGSSQA